MHIHESGVYQKIIYVKLKCIHTFFAFINIIFIFTEQKINHTYMTKLSVLN